MKLFLASWTLCFCIASNLFSQDYDIQWIQGDAPVSIMDFRNDTITFHHINDTISMFITSGNICDKNGNFLFFTNGIYVRDRNGNMMPNGDSLSFYNPTLYAVIYPNGAPQDQGVLILPKPESENLYYIFHYSTVDTAYLKSGQVNNDPLFFYYSIVDMNENNGLGDVVQKNRRLPIKELMCSSRLTAVKHGNGRDWWVIRHGQRENKYIKFLVTPDSILGPFVQYIGPNFEQLGQSGDYYGGSAFFSQNGEKMITANFLGPVAVLDFDRCSGEFSNPLVIKNQLRDTTLLGAAGLTISPNGRFLYVNNIYELNQYDLWSANPNDSIRLYTVDTSDYAWMHTMRLGPEGKIYISQWNGGMYALHVINKPDELGTACDFQFAGQPCITANTVNLPNMVNYRMGKLEGSLCDTLTTDVRREMLDVRQIRVIPNPATNEVKIAMNIQRAELIITDAVGKMVYRNAHFNTEEYIKTNRWATGVYYATITSQQKQWTAKFVKE